MLKYSQVPSRRVSAIRRTQRRMGRKYNHKSMGTKKHEVERHCDEGTAGFCKGIELYPDSRE